MLKAIEDRRRERERLLGVARVYAEALDRRVPLVGAAVAGSVARGDFNVWSDIDIVVAAEDLPDDPHERVALLAAGRPPRVQPFGYTPDELRDALRRGNRLVCEAVERGVAVHGEGLAAFRA